MVKSILEGVGHKVGLIGTIEAIIGDKAIPANNTTPESYTIHQYFAQMVEAGCDSVVMEVSSQGLMLHRTAGIQFEIGIFTNLGEDHIGRTSIRTSKITNAAKGSCLHSAIWELPMWMTDGMKTYLRMPRAKWRLLDSRRRQTFVLQTCSIFQGLDIWESSTR